ncbi:MAG: hypothetical protein M1827_002530 [Pycnora praestabilis]|nr:MAG: hypothetical protein M1827_002530 [Pycnora praestabilis]
MRISSFLAAVLFALPTLIAAHGDGLGGPKVFGRKALADLRSRNVFASPAVAPVPPAAAPPVKREPTPTTPQLEERQNTDGQCGPGYNGWCGNTPDYCNAPDCQFNWGPNCDANKSPAGASTTGVARTQFGNVPYGGNGIYDCTVPGTIALTFDDGPYIYTDHILDVLASYNAKATFFVTAINNGKGEIDNASTIYPAIIQRMHAEGHQIASHTWSHQNLTEITTQQRLDQMVKNERALANILGFFPTYMRPPYSSCFGDCETDLAKLGYHITYFDVDTDDYDNDSPLLIQNAKNNFDNDIAGGSNLTSDYLVIGHDIHEQTAYNLTAYMLTQLLAQGYQPVTVGECLGDPPLYWYRTVGGAPMSTSAVSSSQPLSTVLPNTSTQPSVISLALPSTTARIISPDATCGGTGNYTCLGSAFGSCCSPAGWCGSTDAYCGTGCQPGFGSCGTLGNASVVTSSNVKTVSVASSPTLIASTIISSTLSQSSYTTRTTSTATSLKAPPASFQTSSTSAKGSSLSVVVKAPSSSTTLAAAKPVSTDATCGTTNTCLGSSFGNCCSQHGWCGSTADYCGTGCQAIAGTCT